MSKALDPSFDFCQFQRFVNNVGGEPGLPAFYPDPLHPKDRLGQYGFRTFPDSHYFDRERDEYRYYARPGVYVVWATLLLADDCGTFKAKGYQHVLYVGCSKNIEKRVKDPDHWPERILNHNWPAHIAAVVSILYTQDYLWAEKSLIRTLRPVFNIQHNG